MRPSSCESGRWLRVPRAAALVLLLAVPVRSAAGQDLDKLEFMSGCWVGYLGEDQVVEEIWMDPVENLMLGLTRYLDDKKKGTGWEFTLVEKTDSTTYFIPHSSGQKPDTFYVKTAVSEVAVFERVRPSDDFPLRIMYRRTSDGSNIARLEAPPGSDQRDFELRFRRMRCPE